MLLSLPHSIPASHNGQYSNPNRQHLLKVLNTPCPILPGSREIGNGYDVLNGNYADPESCTYPLFDFEQDGYHTVVLNGNSDRSFSLPKLINIQEQNGVSYVNFFGQTIRDYVKSINSKVQIEGKFNVFSSSMKYDFPDTILENASFSYSRIQLNATFYTLSLPPVAVLKTKLSPTVKHDLEHLSPKDFFTIYGTHFVTSLLVGGRTVQSSSTNMLHYTPDTNCSIENIASLSFKHSCLPTSSLSVDDRLKHSSLAEFTETSKIFVTTKGGNALYGGSKLKANFDKWIASINENPSFVDFVDNQSLLPVWLLAQTSERSKELKDYYNIFCCENQKAFNTDYPLLYAHVTKLNQSNIQYIDRCSIAERNCWVAKPDLSGDWFYLGQVPFDFYDTEASTTTILKEIITADEILKDVSEWTRIWEDDRLTKKDKCFSFWKGIPSDHINYKVMGDFFRGSDSLNPPNQSETKGIKAIHRGCLTPNVVLEKRDWTDLGSQFVNRCRVWNNYHGYSGSFTYSLFTNTMIVTNDDSSPSKNKREVYRLKESILDVVNDRKCLTVPNFIKYKHEQTNKQSI